MREVTAEGRAVIFVSHNLHAVQRLCTRSFLLDGGRIVMDDRPGRVVAEYTHRFGLEQSGVAEIAVDAPRFGTGEVVFRRVMLTERNGRPLTGVYLDQPIIVRVTLEVREPVPQAVLEIGITSVDGERLITVQNIDCDRPPIRLEPGVHEIVTEIDVTLLPNEYTVDVGIHTLDGMTVDWVERVLRFTALNEALSGDDHYRWPTVRGYVRPRSTWSDLLPAVIEGPREAVATPDQPVSADSG
jgi:lipopolysaccharide transport system ATP-binding protein